jgi:hypothetical protein
MPLVCAGGASSLLPYPQTAQILPRRPEPHGAQPPPAAGPPGRLDAARPVPDVGEHTRRTPSPEVDRLFLSLSLVLQSGFCRMRNQFLLRLKKAVLRIRNVYPGSELFPSRIRISPIPDPHQEFKYFNPQKWPLSSRKYDPGCSSGSGSFVLPGSGSQILTFYPSRIRIRNTKKRPNL